MKLQWISVVTAAVLLGAWNVASAGVNCALVRKNMERPGSTVEDVAMTMVIPEEEIRKCLDEKEKEKGDGDEAAAEEKDAAGQ